MKIGVVHEYLLPVSTGGRELLLKFFLEYLLQEGFEIVAITSEQGVEHDNKFPVYKIKSSPFRIPHIQGIPGITYYQLPGVTTPWLYFNFPLRKKLEKIYAQEKIDLLYINALPHLSFAPLQAAGDIPVVLHTADYYPVCFIRDFTFCNKEPYLNKSILRCAYCLGQRISLPAYRRYMAPFLTGILLPNLLVERHFREKSLKVATEIICDSNFTAKVLSNHGYKTTVIPTPYLWEVPPLEEIKRERSKDNVFRILFMGRLEWRKGVDLIPPLAQKLKGKMDFRIDVVGTGYKQKILDRPDLNIYVHGYLGDERFAYLREADCLIAPSLWPETLGMIGVEAMAYGIPTIALRGSGGLAETVLENASGLVADDEEQLADRILELYHNPKLSDTIRENCARGIQKFDKKRIFKELKEVLEKHAK